MPKIKNKDPVTAPIALMQRTMLIVDDHAHLRSVLHTFLQDAFPRCRFQQAADATTALAICREARPDLILMDKCLPDGDGIDLTARLIALYPGLKVIMISYRTEDIYAVHALAAGARAYIPKDRVATELVPALTAAFELSPALHEDSVQ